MSEAVKITALEVESFKRVKAVQIVVAPKGLTIIGGHNMEGKTSVLDAIAATLGGESFGPSDPIHHGEKRATTSVTLSNGLKVERVFTPKGTRLEVIGADGDATGQTLLNKFISAFALDLSQFMKASDKARTKLLLQTIGVDLTPFEVKHSDLYAKRTDIGRQEDRAKGHYESLPYHDGAGEVEQSAASLIAEIQKAEAHNRVIADATQEVARTAKAAADAQAAYLAKDDRGEFDDQAVKDAEAMLAARMTRKTEIESDIADLEERLKKARAGLVDIDQRIETAKNNVITEKRMAIDRAGTALGQADLASTDAKLALKNAGEPIDVAPLQAKLATIEDLNKKIRQNIDRKSAQLKYQSLHEEYVALTSDIEDNEAEMRALLDGSKMPIKGLTVDVEGRLMFRGQAWDCQSGSEQLMVATAICHAVQPAMGFVLVDGAEQMDPDQLAMYGAWLERENIQAITTRVSVGPECSLIIENGEVLEAVAAGK